MLWLGIYKNTVQIDLKPLTFNVILTKRTLHSALVINSLSAKSFYTFYKVTSSYMFYKGCYHCFITRVVYK